MLVSELLEFLPLHCLLLESLPRDFTVYDVMLNVVLPSNSVRRKGEDDSSGLKITISNRALGNGMPASRSASLYSTTITFAVVLSLEQTVLGKQFSASQQ